MKIITASICNVLRLTVGNPVEIWLDFKTIRIYLRSLKVKTELSSIE